MFYVLSFALQAKLVDCAFYNNSATNRGGAIYNANCNPDPMQLLNVAFMGNKDLGPNDVLTFMSQPVVDTLSPGSSRIFRDDPTGPVPPTDGGTIDTSDLTPTEAFIFSTTTYGATVALAQPTAIFGTGNVTVHANLQLSAQLNTTSDSLLVVEGTASFAAGAELVFSTSRSGTFVVMEAAKLEGLQQLRSSVVAALPLSCPATATGSFTTTQNTLTVTLSVTVVVTETCDGGSSPGLSAGALAGIIVGCVVVAVLVTVGAVLLFRYRQMRQDAASNLAIGRLQLANMKGEL